MLYLGRTGAAGWFHRAIFLDMGSQNSFVYFPPRKTLSLHHSNIAKRSHKLVNEILTTAR